MTETVKEKYGFLPKSVWRIDKGDFWKNFIKHTGEPTGENLRGTGGSFYEKHSEFNPLLAQRIYLYWSEIGDTILDPFSGRTTRGLVARAMGRHYEGYEVAPSTYEETKSNLVTLESAWQPQLDGIKELGSFKLWNADGCQLKHSEWESADLIFTCPPYWNVELYEEAPYQLSRLTLYSDFLNKIKECARNCERVLKTGKYCVWVVGDFREKGKLINFHGDIIEAFKASSLKFHDIVVNELFSPNVRAAGNAEAQKYTIKLHEYILVWKK